MLPAGDAAMMVEFGNEISRAVNGRVRGLDSALHDAAISGIVETVPGYRSLLVEYDPLYIPWQDLVHLLTGLAEKGGVAAPEGTIVKQVPTVYGGEDGPDLAQVAAAHHLTEEEVIARHSEAIYTVYMLGFSPGFAFMGEVPPTIATPRLSTPRTQVPAGSVGIAGQQTGIYPQCSPGGWRLLGRTNLVLFDPFREPTCFFQPGDQVRFVPVQATQNESRGLSKQFSAQVPTIGDPSIEIISPGFLTTIQDLGRQGYQRLGVPVSGAMDSFALGAANALVGNPADAAVLEMTLVGPSILFRSAALIAITGGNLHPILYAPDLGRWDVPLWTALYVRPGSVLEFGERQMGCRTCVAVAGGIATPPIMGSRSTYLAGEFGGYEGRALKSGDVLSVNPPRGHPSNLAGRWLPEAGIPNYSDSPTVRVILGPQDDYFDSHSVHLFLSQEYQVGLLSDRMGLRLQGPSLQHTGAKEIISSGIALGAIQVPPDGQPIILMADRQTAGGYPVIATVIRADIPLLAQCVPGQSRVRFRAVTLDEAQEGYRSLYRNLQSQIVDSE